MAQINIRPSEISDVLLQQLEAIDLSVQYEEVGKVLQVSDGVARIYGLSGAEAGGRNTNQRKKGEKRNGQFTGLCGRFRAI